MKTLAVLAAALMVAPLSAAVTVIGSSPARTCYLAALREAGGTGEISSCDLALNSALVEDEIVATHVNRGILRVYRGDLKGGIADYDAAIALDAEEAEAWLNKGLALQRAGAPPAETLPLFDAAVAKGTREPAIAYYARALAHEQAGNVRAAYGDLVKARALAPKWSAPAQELSRYQVRRRS